MTKSGVLKSSSIFLIVAVFSLSLFIVKSNAQDVGAGGIGGRPAYPREDNDRSKSIFIHTIQNGDSVSDGVIVVNNTNETRSIKVYATDSIRSSGGAFACAQFVDEKSDVGSWITLEKDIVELEPSTTETVNFTINVPVTADAGEHNGCIVVQENIDPTDSEQGIGLSFRTATRVALLLPGDLSRADLAKKLEYRDFRYSVQHSTVTLTPVIENLGIVSVDTDIQTTLATIFGNAISTEGGTFPVLRTETGDWNFEHPRPIWGGIYRAQTDASYDQNPDNFLGEGEADFVTIDYPDRWVFLWPTLLGAIIEILILLIIIKTIYDIRKKLKEKRDISKNWYKHTLKKSVSIKVIAKSRNMSWKKLAKANKLKPPYHLEAGQTIIIPPKPDKKKEK